VRRGLESDEKRDIRTEIISVRDPRVDRIGKLTKWRKGTDSRAEG